MFFLEKGDNGDMGDNVGAGYGWQMYPSCFMAW